MFEQVGLHQTSWINPTLVVFELVGLHLTSRINLTLVVFERVGFRRSSTTPPTLVVFEWMRLLHHLLAVCRSGTRHLAVSEPVTHPGAGSRHLTVPNPSPSPTHTRTRHPSGGRHTVRDTSHCPGPVTQPFPDPSPVYRPFQHPGPVIYPETDMVSVNRQLVPSCIQGSFSLTRFLARQQLLPFLDTSSFRTGMYPGCVIFLFPSSCCNGIYQHICSAFISA